MKARVLVALAVGALIFAACGAAGFAFVHLMGWAVPAATSEPRAATPTPAIDHAVEHELHVISLILAFDGMTNRSQNLVCDGYRTLGPTATTRNINADLTPEQAIPQAAVVDALEAVCW